MAKTMSMSSTLSLLVVFLVSWHHPCTASTEREASAGRWASHQLRLSRMDASESVTDGFGNLPGPVEPPVRRRFLKGSLNSALNSTSHRRVEEERNPENKFELYSSHGIYEGLQELAAAYPDLVTLESAQARFGLDYTGDEDECSHEGHTNGCSNWILTIEDKQAFSQGSEASKMLPEVYLSGALHGDERVGPTALLETARILLAAADCEAQDYLFDDDCQQNLLEKYGIGGANRRWLARLVVTRRIVITPTTNALGYYRNERYEGDFDPNRDFPFDMDPHSRGCMKTIAARTVNELFREHLFQIALTFHAGIELLGYEWGNPEYDGSDATIRAPDHRSQNQITRDMAHFAGGFTPHLGGSEYPSGPMNDELYSVHGGMEDWAYGASWVDELKAVCNPETHFYSSYPPQRTEYTSSHMRAFSLLVETSDEKTPQDNTLGYTNDILDETSGGNGHIPRNVRLALMAIDIVQPYARILSFGGNSFTLDVGPKSNVPFVSCRPSSDITIPEESESAEVIEVKWTVGGALTVAATSVIAVRWEDLPKGYNCGGQVTQSKLKEWAEKMGASIQDQIKPQEGRTRWHEDGAFPVDNSSVEQGPVFSAHLDMSVYEAGDSVAIIAMAQVDKAWGDEPFPKSTPNRPPQSHIANARTNPDWAHAIGEEVEQKKIQGRLVWMSTPIVVHIAENEDN